MKSYGKELFSLIAKKYSTLIDDIKFFVDVLSRRPLKAIVINKRLTNDPAYVIELLKSYNPIPVKWSNYIYYSTNERLGNNLLHHLGLYYVMDLVNTILPLVLSNKDTFFPLIVDVSASPGGKTYLFSNRLYPDKPLIIANEPFKSRVPALLSNINRLLLDNVIVTRYRGESFPRVNGLKFILFDAPCSSANLFYKNPRIVLDNISSKVRYLSKTQKRIIKNLYKILEPGGLVIYSTCTFTVEECEEVIDYALRIGFDIIKPSLTYLKYQNGIEEWNGKVFDSRVKYSVRIMPHINYELYHGNIGLLYLAILRRGY